MSIMEVSRETRTRIKEILSKIESAKDIFELFKALNYPEDVVFDITAKRKKDSFEFRSDDEQKVKEIYSVLSLENKLHVFLLETTSIAPSFIRSVTATFDRQYLNFLLILTVDYSEVVFLFPNREKINEDQHKLKLIKLIVNRDEIYYTDVQTLTTLLYKEGTKRRQVWRQWRSAFSVERVTKNFFDDYKKVFFLLKKELSTQGIPKKESHEFTLQLLNRIMFVYFISKKEDWLNTKRFMKWLWDSYKKQEKYGDDEFYEIWLKQVFFKAFNNQSNLITYLPSEVKNEISNFPFLNGGLFTSNDLDALDIEISDELYEKIHKFYEKYNFTIKEDMPLEEEVAVDPQMIGYVYESLANVADEIYDRHDIGIFYTPRVEVNFMAKSALIEYLSKNIEDIPKEKLYHLVFDPPEEKKNAIKDFDEKFWYRFEEVLDNLSAVDPACGSGAFLVGLLNILTELYRLVYQHLNRKVTEFELKKRIIQYSLYGVDIMPWAIHAAELRLWLQLMVETELKKEELRKYPLLPNLDLNLRIGDSLVQEIGGLFFNLRTSDLEPAIKRKLSNLKDEKRNYFDNLPRAKFKTPLEVKEEELRLFKEIIESRMIILNSEIKNLKNTIRREKSQKDLQGKPIFDKKKVATLESKIKKREDLVKSLIELKDAIKIPEKRPFIWDIDFAEIFGDKNGFDIVIGNPPYVKQEDIAPFNKIKSQVSVKEKKDYKNKLINSVKNRFPVIKKIDGKSDYYIYFYFHGLSLLNERGIFCFITSNSWLDVGYGKNLQEFILKNVAIVAIYDSPERTFEQASINTVIVLLSAPKFQSEKTIAGLRVLEKEVWSMLDNTAKFVMFNKSFEEAINTKNLIEINNIETKLSEKDIVGLIKNFITTENYRVFPIKQLDLLNDGWKYPDSYNENDERFKKGSYSGNKWGGKFLRSPEIFFVILEKGLGKFVKLNSIAKIRAGCYSGLNDFFYLKDEKLRDYEIESNYLTPLIRSSEIVKTLKIQDTLGNYVLSIPLISKSELKKKKHNKILSYIEWGETQVTKSGQKTKSGIPWNKVESVKKRKFWYSIPGNNLLPTNTFMQYIANERFYCPFSEEKLVSDRCFHRIYANEGIGHFELCASLNSSIQAFFVMLLGRYNLGQGAMKFEVMDAKNLLTFDIRILTKESLRKLKEKLEILGKRKPLSFFDELGIDASRPIREQKPDPKKDRYELDKIFFDELKLSDEEINEIYWSICELINKRLKKSQTFRN